MVHQLNLWNMIKIEQTHNMGMKLIRQPVAFIAKIAIMPTEQLTTYVGRYVPNKLSLF